jgi:hypothetical protein
MDGPDAFDRMTTPARPPPYQFRSLLVARVVDGVQIARR